MPKIIKLPPTNYQVINSTMVHIMLIILLLKMFLVEHNLLMHTFKELEPLHQILLIDPLSIFWLIVAMLIHFFLYHLELKIVSPQILHLGSWIPKQHNIWLFIISSFKILTLKFVVLYTWMTNHLSESKDLEPFAWNS